MEIKEIAVRAAAALAADPNLAEIPVIVEESGDASTELQINIAKRKVAVVVGWNGFTGDGNSSRTIFGKANIVVSVFEMPVVNRRAEGAKTLLQIARSVAHALNLFTVGGDTAPLVFKRITPVQQLTEGENATVACDVEFEVATTL